MQMSTRRFDPQTRAQLALRFRAMYQSLGLDLPGCAKLLHVTERTLHNWMSGKHDIPYTAYRLLRLLNRMELPGQTWDGWCFYGGKLWSPEGRSFTGTEAAWWSLLVRRASMFSKHQRRKDGSSAARTDTAAQAERAAVAGSEALSPTAAAGGRREAPALDLSNKHFRTLNLQNPANAQSFAIKSIAYKGVA